MNNKRHTALFPKEKKKNRKANTHYFIEKKIHIEGQQKSGIRIQMIFFFLAGFTKCTTESNGMQ